MPTYYRSDCVTFRKTKEAFGFLSNMCSGFPLKVNGISIRTSEALYQLCRFPSHPKIQQKVIDQKSPMAAKMVTKPYRSSYNRKDWDLVRVDVMRWSLQIKLLQHYENFGALLASTDTKPIVEISHKDDFWGTKVDRSNMNLLIGDNVLGNLLMELRDTYVHKENTLTEVIPLEVPHFKLLGRCIEIVN